MIKHSVHVISLILLLHTEQHIMPTYLVCMTSLAIFVLTWSIYVCLIVCFGGRQGKADRLNCNPLQRVGIPFFRDLASRPRTLLLLLPSMFLRGQDESY